MSGASKLNNIGMAKTQHQLDMEALSKPYQVQGAAPSLPAHMAAAPAPQADMVPAQAGETPEEAAVAGQQAANANDPGTQDKLNMMAKARAKFYGEGQ